MSLRFQVVEPVVGPHKSNLKNDRAIFIDARQRAGIGGITLNNDLAHADDIDARPVE